MMQHLRSVPASELARHAPQLISIDTGTTVDDALSLMKKRNILSLPVFDHFKEEWVGILTIQDLLMFVAFKDFDSSGDGTLKRSMRRSHDSKNQIEPRTRRVRSQMSSHAVAVQLILLLASVSFSNGIKPAGDVIRERTTQLPIADVADQISDLLEPFCKAVHRMLVRVPSSGTAESDLKMVTQTDVIRYVSSHATEFDIPGWNESVEEAGMLRETIKMNETETALEGFRRMAAHDCNALPIVNEHGKVTGTLSGADLRGLTSNLIQRVTMPALEFLKETSRGIVRIPMTIAKNETIGKAALKLVLARVHRVWIVDDSGAPIGVVSTTDVIHHLYKHLSC